MYDRIHMTIFIICLCGLCACLAGCEDDDRSEAITTVSTEELEGGAIKTSAREPLTGRDGATVTQVTTTITYPDGTTETSVAMDGASLPALSDGSYSRYSRWVTLSDAATELPANAFPLWSIESTNYYADPSQTGQSSNGHVEDGTNDMLGGRWVVLSDGVSNSLEIQTYP